MLPCSEKNIPLRYRRRPRRQAGVTVDARDWSCRPLVAARLERPIDLAINPSDEALYIVDSGQSESAPFGRLGATPSTDWLRRIRSGHQSTGAAISMKIPNC